MPQFYTRPLEVLKSILQSPEDYDVQALIDHKLYWAQLELNQPAPFSFTAFARAHLAGESVIQFKINHIPEKLVEFAYLFIARYEVHTDGIDLINTMRKNPDAFLTNLD